MNQNGIVIRTKFSEPITVRNGETLEVTSRITLDDIQQGQTIIEAECVSVRVVTPDKE